ncbi:MAG: Asp-tRNA(Asn)/Glu-tRNA(Gln) amidotransferase subunit GatA [Candidatus Omnitrophica bacterium]|nr:Asp-tRNA(Asn)/Glu-tRNA(Gln) amidotransferase subunit GatA [Candidatus Omnitrophota bacterium]MBD3269582.1 Asp-tRNA(Asn)/Glu-tRNA(Gln) amidotransferase subunit GatA [Candidatus Omnitrophota bacterium]
MNKLELSRALDIAEKIRKKEIDEGEVYDSYVKKIEKVNPSLNIFVDVYPGKERLQGDSPLRGVPIAVKDNICVEGKKITCASRILKSHIAVYDATVIKRIKDNGLAVIGTTNMDEFAFGSSTENSCYGPAKNPWNKDYVVGGSSGGSAAAVAARLVPMALGSDTGGSIRQPASLCGVVGFKPTYGRVSRYGLVAFGSSLDQIGPITTNFCDCAYLLNIICGFDERDSTSVKIGAPDFTRSLDDNIRDIKIGIPKEYFGEGLDGEVDSAIKKTIDFYKEKGAEVKEISLPHTEYAVATYYIIASSEASSNLQRFDGVRYGLRTGSAKDLKSLYLDSRKEGLGGEAKRRIFLGTHSLSSGYYDAYYLKALKSRRLIKNDFDRAFEKVDAILTPTSPTPAFKIGEKTDDPLLMYLSDIYTISVNLAGLPAVSFPCAFTKGNLPIGAQLIGREFQEDTLIKLGYAFQESTDYHKRIPELDL